MFKDSSLFIIASDFSIYRLEKDRIAQTAICETFSSSVGNTEPCSAPS